MSRTEREMNEYGKRVLSPLQPVPPTDPEIMQAEKAKFLLKGEHLRNNLVPGFTGKKSGATDVHSGGRRGWASLPIYKALWVAVLLLVLLAASSLTVYAAQSSLPGDALYAIKSVSEDIRLSLTFTPQAKLNLTMDYTTKRVGEIQSLVRQGKSLPDQTSQRYLQELEDELQLAAQMNDQAMQTALLMIKVKAEDQGMTVEELIARLPNRASPAIIRLQERLLEQIQLSTIGESNPQAFRTEIQEREHGRHGPRKPSASDQPASLSTEESATGIPSLQSTKDVMDQGTAQPEHVKPGNGNHNPNPTHTPKP